MFDNSKVGSHLLLFRSLLVAVLACNCKMQGVLCFLLGRGWSSSERSRSEACIHISQVSEELGLKLITASRSILDATCIIFCLDNIKLALAQHSNEQAPKAAFESSSCSRVNTAQSPLPSTAFKEFRPMTVS